MLECPLVKHEYVPCGHPLGSQTPLIQAIGCNVKGTLLRTKSASCERNLLISSLAVHVIKLGTTRTHILLTECSLDAV